MKNIWTNGCFDVIHVGHIRLFEYAKSLGEKLFVGIDSDNRVKKLKGNNRPINNQNYRKELLQSIKWIDSVYIFDSDTELENLIHELGISTMVIGDDYKDKRIVGINDSLSVIYFSKIPNLSTSKILSNGLF